MFNLDDITVKTVLDKLNSHGESALYGGFIRDKILKIEPNDVDIVTSLSAQKIYELFPKSKPRETITGLKLISFSQGKHHFEISPDCILLKEKVLHADLNINSLMYNGIHLLDYNNVIDDFENKVIKCINSHEFLSSVNERPFGWIKPLRLSAITGFRISDELIDVLLQSKHSLDNISKGIFNQEAYRILNSNNTLLSLKYLVDLGLISKFEYEDCNQVDFSNINMKFHMKLAYLSNITSNETINDFIKLFQLPKLIEENYMRLMQAYNHKEQINNYVLHNEILVLKRLLEKK